MTLQREQTADLFGLASTFPRPGWVVLDAARDHRFTGELVFDVAPESSVFLDRGKIYLAERSTDPSLGARLVDAGALSASQLEHGAMRVGEIEHLGRLFERVPSVDRQTTLLTTELMNEACVVWLARQHVRAVVSIPYRHHPTGIHRWDRPSDAIDLSPGDPLPAPEPTQPAIEIAPPESVFAEFSNDTDPIIHWDEPSWLDERVTPASSAARHDHDTDEDHGHSHEQEQEQEHDDHTLLTTDWTDRLEHEGLPEPGSDPLTPTAKLPAIPVEPADQFEVIWPSGAVEADFPADASHGADDDRDRAGPTARVVRAANVEVEPPPAPDDAGLWDVESTGPSFGPDSVAQHPVESPAMSAPTVDEPVGVSDDLALSMRRAVASIETGSLAARRRLSDATQHAPPAGIDLELPGRVATRNESSMWSANRAATEPVRSVFDEPTPSVPVDPTDGRPRDGANGGELAPEPERVSALRRLIGGLRRR